MIFSLEILNLYWESLRFRGGSNFSLRINWKRIVCNGECENASESFETYAKVQSLEFRTPPEAFNVGECAYVGDGQLHQACAPANLVQRARVERPAAVQNKLPELHAGVQPNQ